MQKKKYVLVGTGGRAQFFYGAIAKEFCEIAELTGFCDINQTRMDYANKLLQEKYNHIPVRTYLSNEFDTMIEREKPDVVIVTSIDRTHHTYIIRAMELGCDVITEKPMTIDEEKCQAIIDTIKKTEKKLRVAFNYRYAPHATKIHDLIQDGFIGDVFSVHFEWLLNIKHGADYFRRWHRDRRNSGGLLVHKSTHHFDLVNYWLQETPQMVYALGGLRFYGRENAESRGVTQFYQRSYKNKIAKNDPFAIHLEQNSHLTELYLNAEHEDGYFRDQSAFGDGISIEDTMGVMVKYQNKAILTYSLNAYMPWEGFVVNFSGSKGRLEVKVVERSYVSNGDKMENEGALKNIQIVIHPMFGEPYEIDVQKNKGAHGGGDPILLKDIFDESFVDLHNRASSHVDGAMSILTGIGANISMRTGLPVSINELVDF